MDHHVKTKRFGFVGRKEVKSVVKQLENNKSTCVKENKKRTVNTRQLPAGYQFISIVLLAMGRFDWVSRLKFWLKMSLVQPRLEVQLQLA